MAGFLDSLRGFGSAHLQHVQALTQALQTADMQAARDQLADYLQGLSGPALMGFRASLQLLLHGEGNPQVAQALQWVAAHIDGLRAGQFRALTPGQLPRHGLSLEQVSTLITPWASLSQAQGQANFLATLQALDGQGRHEFAAHLDTLAVQVQAQIGQLQQQQDDNTAWGHSFEDRMAYMQARIASGAPAPQSALLGQQQAILQALQQMALAARQWQEPTPAAAPSAPAPKASAAPPAQDSGFDAPGLLAQLKQQFQQARTEMDPARAAALDDFMQRLGTHIDRDAAQPAPADDASIEDRRADLQRSMASVSELRRQAEELREMQRHVRRPEALPPGSRAAVIGPWVDALVDDVSGLRNTPTPSTRETEAAALKQLHLALIKGRSRLRELAGNDADLRHYERDALRATVHALRLFHRRGHLMLARPVWPGGAARVDPGQALFAGGAGADAVLGLVDRECAARSLALGGSAAPGVDTATALWRGMQSASLAVLDLSDGDPQVYYQLGQAYALGTELLLMARRGTRLPFDVAQAVLTYADTEELASRLPAALDAALYGVQTLGLSALMHSTLARCRDIATRAVGADHTELLLEQLQASVLSPLEFRAALEQFLAQLGNSRLVLIHPRWPAQYPDPEARRAFVVMPFAEALRSTQQLYRELDAALSAAGVLVVRGDIAAGQDIVASIWEETARASHVLVDLTGYNLNVCLELGMADAMGRDTLLFGAAGYAEQRFAAIDKRRIHSYGDEEGGRGALCDQVIGFVRRPPTL